MGAGEGLRVFYDGGCGLCHRAVRFLARRDQGLRFAPLGGEAFRREVPDTVQAELPDSLVARTPEGCLLVRSGAVIHLLGRLGGAWALVARALACLPRPWRDGLYDTVARRRGGWFRRPSGICPSLPADQRARFDP